MALITVTWNGSDFHAGVTFYGDGAPIGDSNRADGAGVQDSDAGVHLVLGNVDWPAADRCWNGSMDEIRISNVERSPAWIAAQYLSMSDSFLTFGSEQTVE